MEYFNIIQYCSQLETERDNLDASTIKRREGVYTVSGKRPTVFRE